MVKPWNVQCLDLAELLHSERDAVRNDSEEISRRQVKCS